MQAEEGPVDANVPTPTRRENHRGQLRARRAKLLRLRFVVGKHPEQPLGNGGSVVRGHAVPPPLRRAARHRTAAKFQAIDTATYRR